MPTSVATVLLSLWTDTLCGIWNERPALTPSPDVWFIPHHRSCLPGTVH